MSETVITVQGHHTGRFEPEHAVVQATVSFDGPSREPVFARATEIAAQLTAELAELHHETDGPVIRWNADRVRVWSQRPWNEHGKQLPPVYHAQLEVVATFTDTEALAAWIERLATTDGVQVGELNWGLSRERERAALAEVRAAAVTDALDRARAYASSLGLTELEPLAIADPGMLGDSNSGSPGGPVAMDMMMARSAKGGGGELSFTPRDLELSAAVDARFRAH